MVFSNNLLFAAAAASSGSTPFDPTLIGNSVWLDGSADFLSAELGAKTRTKAVIGTWIQKTGFSTADSTIFSKKGTAHFAMRMQDQASKAGKISIFDYDGSSFQYSAESTSMLLRDIGWYHIMISIDTTAIAGNRLRYYINGIDQTSTLTVSTDYTANDNPSITGGSSEPTQWGVGPGGASQFNPCYLAQSFMLDDDSIQNGDVAVTDILDAFTIGTNGSQFTPKSDAAIAALATTAGGDSFCLDFADSSDLGNDISSNANDFTTTSMAAANQSSNTPSLVYPLLNPLSAAFSTTLSNGNTTASGTTGNGDDINPGIIIPKTGKWVWQITNTTDADLIYGVRNFKDMKAGDYSYTNLYGFYSHTGDLVQGASPSGSYLDAASGGDVYQIYYNAETRKMWVSDNGTIPNSGDPDAGSNEAFTIPDSGFDLCPTALVGGTAPNSTFDFGLSGVTLHANGQSFKPLTSANLPAPDYQGIDYFAPTLYEGNGQNQRVGDFVPFTDTFTVANSAMFDDGDRRYLARTYSAGDTARSGTTCTISYWIKYCSSANSQYVIATSESGQTKRFIIYIDSSGASSLILDPPGGGNNRTFTVPAIFLSEQEWTNFVWQVDPDNATAADKVKAWVNGVQITSTDTSYQSASSSDYFLFDNEEHFVGNLPPASAGYTAFCLNSYLAELNVLDGQLKAPTDFGEVDTSTNRWIPKDYDTNVGTYGNRGFYLAYNGTFGGFTKIDDSSSSYSGNMTNGGGLSAAFDGNITKNNAACAQGANTNSNDSFIVVDHGSAKTVTQFIAYASQDAQGFDGDSGGSTITFTLRGSTDNFSGSDDLLYTTTTADGAGKVFTVSSGITSGAYQYHKMTVQTNTTNAGQKYGQLAQLEYYIDAATDAGTDTSGNGFNFTESFVSGGSAWATTDQFIDTPSANYAILDSGRAGASIDLAEGNLKSAAGTDQNVQATMAIPESGKWAFTANINVLDFSFGIVSEQNSLTTKIGRTSTSWGIIESTGASLFNVEHNSVGSFNLGSQPSVNDKLIAAIDMDTNSLWLGYDTGSGFTYFGGGDPATGTTPTYQGVLVTGQRLYFAVASRLSVSFGGQSASLYGTLPTDFLELNQDNLDDTASKLTALAWIKNRDATDSHVLVDRVRGVGEVIHSNEDAAEATEPNTVQRFLQRGVQVGSDVQVNTANESYVLWQWLMGDSATTGTVNNDGSIASTLIAADAGYLSIGTYTGTGANATVGHGLGGAPEMIIVKDLDTASTSWPVYHEYAASDAETDNLVLNTTAALFDDATKWNDTAPTSTVFSIGTNSTVNANTKSYFFITFRSVAGVCKVGSYTGNGNADGPYIDLGFKPAFFLQKKTSGTADWYIHDSKRNPFNVVDKHLRPSTSAIESTFTAMDFLSNGVKIRTSNGDFNTSTGNYIYLAMADIGGNGTLPPIYGR